MREEGGEEEEEEQEEEEEEQEEEEGEARSAAPRAIGGSTLRSCMPRTTGKNSLGTWASRFQASPRLRKTKSPTTPGG